VRTTLLGCSVSPVGVVYCGLEEWSGGVECSGYSCSKHLRVATASYGRGWLVQIDAVVLGCTYGPFKSPLG
jgi:hypothetical protein